MVKNNISGLLKKRLLELQFQKPTISIFKGKRRLIAWGGEQRVEDEVYIQLDVSFREKQLAELKGGAKLAVFICLALHINEEGYSHPSVDLICKETGYSKDAVYEALDALEKRGYISRKKRKHPKTNKLISNLYRIFPLAYSLQKEQPENE